MKKGYFFGLFLVLGVIFNLELYGQEEEKLVWREIKGGSPWYNILATEPCHFSEADYLELLINVDACKETSKNITTPSGVIKSYTCSIIPTKIFFSVIVDPPFFESQTWFLKLPNRLKKAACLEIVEKVIEQSHVKQLVSLRMQVITIMNWEKHKELNSKEMANSMEKDIEMTLYLPGRPLYFLSKYIKGKIFLQDEKLPEGYSWDKLN